MKDIKKQVTSWLGIFLGCTIMAAGFVLFINPYGIVPGGVYGASIVLHSLFPTIQVGTFGYMFDIPLLILSVVLLGSKLGGRTIAAALSTPFIMNAISWLVYPSQAALEALDPAQMLGGTMNMTDHLMLTTLMGATIIGIGQGIVVRNQATTGGSDIVAMIIQKYFHIKFSTAILLTTLMGATIIGIGQGIVVRNQATTGGSDIVAMIIQKYFHIKFSTAILLVDTVVVAFGLVVIGFGIGIEDEGQQASWHLSLYSLIAIFICSRVLARVITGAKNDKLIFVISDNKLHDLHDYILHDLDRTATCIKSSGLYTGADKEMIFLVVSYKEVAGVKQLHDLHDYILHDLDRTATCIKSSGLYTGADKEMIFLVVSYKEVAGVKLKIREADPRSFVIVTDAYDTFGEGWKPLPEKGEVEPE